MKTPKVKKRVVSHNSRAARRGEEPPSKDLLVAKSKAPVEETDYKPWLHNTQNAGVGKKKKAKQLTRQQKVRQQKLFEKADVNVNKLERKVEGSKARSKRVQDRAKAWEELNQALELEKEKKGGKMPGAVVDEPTTVDDGGAEAVMDDAGVTDVAHAGTGAVTEAPDIQGVMGESAFMTAEPEIDVDEVT